MVVRRCAALLALAACVGACGAANAPWPGDAVESYESALAEGNYASACGLFDSGARGSLESAMGRHASCTNVLSRCVPYRPAIAKQDQSQLLYANVLVHTHGRKAEVSIRGTAVSKEIHEVSLRKEQGQWKLTSYGRKVTACVGKRRRAA